MSQVQLTVTEGTYCFWAPEMCEEDSFNGLKTDVWAVGVCAWCFVWGTLPFYHDLPTELFDLIVHSPLPFPKGCRDSLQEFMDRLLTKGERLAHSSVVPHSPCIPQLKFFYFSFPDPSQRSSIEEAMGHAWLVGQLPPDYPQRSPAYLVEVSEKDVSDAITATSTMSMGMLFTASVQLRRKLLKARESLEEEAVAKDLASLAAKQEEMRQSQEVSEEKIYCCVIS
jgi:serine/threonine protein kinase